MLIALIILLVLIILLCCMIIYHHIKLNVEKKLIVPNGKIVKVDNDDFHVYIQGIKNEKPTIVVMSGSAIPSPVYSYKKLCDKFSDDFRIIVPEKFGYGYSNITNTKRDTETILEQTRKALSLAGEKPPYILMPHSMSGIEAQLWAHKYPDEVVSIIGLDMALPYHYERMNVSARLNQILSLFIRNLGLQRLSFLQKAAGIYDKPFLSSEEWKQEKFLIAKMTLNKNIAQESTTILDDAMRVKNNDALNIPMLLFVSDGKVQKHWIEDYKKYISQEQNAELVELGCGHMLHNYCADIIAAKTKSWLSHRS